MMTSLPFTQEQIDKFWSKVDKTPGLGRGDCWFWMGRRNPGGYGLVSRTTWKGQQLAHRVSYLLTNGGIDERDIICHKCHCPPCVNPEHIYAGTHATNGRDKSESGRASALRGDLNGNCIFTWKQVDNIRQEFSVNGVSIGKLAKRYGVGDITISRIVNNQMWVDEAYQPPAPDDRGLPKLTQQKADEIREIYASTDCTFKSLAEKFQINKLEISRIIRNEIWKNPDYIPPIDLERRTKVARTFKGEANGSSKLTWEAVKQIRTGFKDGETPLNQIAADYGVDQTLIALIIDNRAWKDESYLPPDRKRIERRISQGDHAEIYRLYTEEGVKQKDLAVRFGVVPTRITKIISTYKKKHNL